jgi:hypothetical protein
MGRHSEIQSMRRLLEHLLMFTKKVEALRQRKAKIINLKTMMIVKSIIMILLKNRNTIKKCFSNCALKRIEYCLTLAQQDYWL